MRRRLQYSMRSVVMVGLLLLQISCLKEDAGDCNSYLTLHFSYTHHTEGKDLFEGEVKSLSLYIFDTSGYLQRTVAIKSSELSSGNHYTFALDEGEYTITVWGNPEEEFYLLPEGSDRPVMTISLKTDANGEYLIPESDLFYGNLAVSFTAKEHKEAEVSLIKISNKVRVLFKGDDLSVRITGSNGTLDFEGNPAGSIPLSYKTTYSTTEHEGEKYKEGAFRILRLTEGDDTSIVLSREGETLREDNLVALIMEHFPQIKTGEDLDRHSEYLFVYDYDRSGQYALSFIRAGEWSTSFGQSGGI